MYICDKLNWNKFPLREKGRDIYGFVGIVVTCVDLTLTYKGDDCLSSFFCQSPILIYGIHLSEIKKVTRAVVSAG